jgi:shikimate kinase
MISTDLKFNARNSKLFYRSLSVMSDEKRIVLTGFMGVGKSTVAKCLAYILQCEKIDLDKFIEQNEQREVVEIIEREGEARFREIETENLRKILAETDARVIALGGGSWIPARNRELIRRHKCTTVWLESTFEHCWRNISCSRQARPLAKDRKLAEKLFAERQKIYCLADWHLIVAPQLTSFEIAKKIAEEIL